MSDPARNQTDKELARMEKYLASIFAEAEKKLISDAKRFLDKFNEEDSKMKAAVDSGDLDEDDYNDWRVDRLRRGDELHKMITRVKKEMANCNKTATDYINGKVPDIFAINYNSIAEVIANSPVNGYTFELIDANTVRNIVTADDVFLPPPQKELDVTKDMLWNAKQVNAQLLQGILLGESVDEIAGRMANVCNSNASAARRNARTMITAAENSGRQSGMNKAEKDGIVFKKKWIATGDERTRETHIMLNGQLVDNDENFVTINGDEIQFPGDPHAKPGEVYNCRCSLGSKITGFKTRNGKTLEVSPKSSIIESKEEHKEYDKRSALFSLFNSVSGLFDYDSKSDYTSLSADTLEQLSSALLKLEDKFGAIAKYRSFGINPVFQTHVDRKSARGSAVMSEGIMSINGKMFKNPERLKLALRLEILFKYKMPCKSENLISYTVTHEYGHFIQGTYYRELTGKPFRAWGETPETKEQLESKEFADNIMDEIIQIAKTRNPKFKLSKSISDYGSKKSTEFFAECFANSQLGKPNELGDAMNIWLERKGLLL